MMLTDKNDNKQAKVLNDLASFYVSNNNIDFTPPGSPHKVTPPSSDSEQDQPSAIDQSRLEAFSNLFVSTAPDGPSRRRKIQHPPNRKQSVVAVAMATSVDKDLSRRAGRRGPMSTSQLDCDDYSEMEIPLKGEEDDDNEEYNYVLPKEPTMEEKSLSALEKLKRRSQSVDVRRVQRSRSDDLMEMDQGRRSNSQDARRRARRRGEDGMDSSIHSAAMPTTEGFSALEKLKVRSSSMERKRVAPGRSQSDDLLERELRQLCSNPDTRRRHGHGHHDDDDDRSKCTQSTANGSKGGEYPKVNGRAKEENPPVPSRTIDRGLMVPVRRKSSDLLDMGSNHRPQSVRKHRSGSEAENETTAPLAHDADTTQPLKSDERSSGSSEKPHSRASSRERRRVVPERSKSDDLVDLDPNRHYNSHDSRRRARRSSGDDSSVVSTEIRPSSMHGLVVRKNSAEGEGSQETMGSAGQVLTNTDDHSNTSSEKPKSSRSSSRERRRAAPEGPKSENSIDLHKTPQTLGNHFGKRRGRRPTGEDASYVESIAETPKANNTTANNASLDGRGSRHSTRGSRPTHRSKSVDVAFEMDVSRRSAASERRRHRATSKTRQNTDYLDDTGEVVKPASEISLGMDVRKKPQSARDASKIMAMHGDEGENDRKESLRQERRTRSSSQAKWADLRRGMESIEKAHAHLEERRNGRQTQRDRRAAAHSDASSVVSSTTSNRDERSSRANLRTDKDRERSSRGHVGSSDGPPQVISERRIQPSESFDAKIPQGQDTTPSTSASSKDASADRISEATTNDQISASKGHSDKTEPQDDSDKVEPKKPQSSAFRTLLGANIMKKTSSTVSSNDDGGVAPAEPISDESMHKGRSKGMNVLKKLLTAPSATSSEKAETADAAKKGARWGGLRSGVDFTSRLIRSTAESKKTSVESEKDDQVTGEDVTTPGNEDNRSSSPCEEDTKESSCHPHVEGSMEDGHESEESSVERSSNQMRAPDSNNRPHEGKPPIYSRNEKVDPVPPADGTALISPELLEVLNGAPTHCSLEQQGNGDRRGMMKGLAAPSLRFEGNHADKGVPRFQPDTSTILEEDEDLLEDKSNSRHRPVQTTDRVDEASVVDENQRIIVGDSDGDESDDEPSSFLSPLKCMQLNFKPTFSHSGDLLVAIHALDHEQEHDDSDDDESVKVHGMKMDGFEIYDDTNPAGAEGSDASMDDSNATNDINAARQQELAAEFEYLERQLCESRVRIQASNEALRILQREMQQQTRLFEETKKRGRALKRVLREQNVLLLFN